MPAGDGTGPMGMGRMSGRGAGYCAGYTMPGFMNPMPGRGRRLGFTGRGRGGGRHGWRHRFYETGLPFWARNEVPEMVNLGPAPEAADELQMLKNQAGHLEQTLAELRRRIADLESTAAKEN